MIEFNGYKFMYSTTPFGTDHAGPIATCVALLLIIALYVGWYFAAIQFRRWRVNHDKKEKKRALQELSIMKEVQSQLEEEIAAQMKQSIQ